MVSAPGAKSAASDCILLCFAVTGNYCACCMRRKCIITRTCTMSACTRWPAITIMMCNAFCRDRLLCREIDQSSSLVANVFILHRCRVRSPPPTATPCVLPTHLSLFPTVGPAQTATTVPCGSVISAYAVRVRENNSISVDASWRRIVLAEQCCSFSNSAIYTTATSASDDTSCVERLSIICTLNPTLV